jgi:hypothetical protein
MLVRFFDSKLLRELTAAMISNLKSTTRSPSPKFANTRTMRTSQSEDHQRLTSGPIPKFASARDT